MEIRIFILTSMFVVLMPVFMFFIFSEPVFLMVFMISFIFPYSIIILFLCFLSLKNYHRWMWLPLLVPLGIMYAFAGPHN